MKKRDFLTLSDLSLAEHEKLLARAAGLKQIRKTGKLPRTLEGRTLLMLFEKSSTRTRLSFESGMAQLGGSAISLPIADSQMGRGEPLEDTARVISRYVDAIVFRTYADARLRAFAAASVVPVINGLTDGGHPIQLLADLLTVQERLGRTAGVRIAFVGDGSSNMARSYVEASRIFNFPLHLCAPLAYRPPPAELHPGVTLFERPEPAVEGCQVIVTDVWTSMGQEDQAAARKAAFAGYCVDAKLMARADRSAMVMHCLPAHRGEEISAEVLEGIQSAVWDEAENRMHAQNALLELLIRGS